MERRCGGSGGGGGECVAAAGRSGRCGGNPLDRSSYALPEACQAGGREAEAGTVGSGRSGQPRTLPLSERINYALYKRTKSLQAAMAAPCNWAGVVWHTQLPAPPLQGLESCDGLRTR